MSKRMCSVEGCPNEYRARGYCTTHLSRLKRYGSLDVPPKPERPECAHDSCMKPARTKGYCKQCYLQFWRYGTVERSGPLTGSDHPHWADAPTYSGWHARLRNLRGAASDHPCGMCGGVADEWALTKEPTGDLHFSDKGLPYTVVPDDYIPLCRADHRNYDDHDQKVRETWRSK